MDLPALKIIFVCIHGLVHKSSTNNKASVCNQFNLTTLITWDWKISPLLVVENHFGLENY